MKIAVVFGSRSDSFVKTFRSIRDDIDYYPYSSIESCIHDSVQRGLNYDRILLTTKMLATNTEALAESLYKFARTSNSDTSVVLVCAEGEGKQTGVVDIFSRYFTNHALHTPVSLPATTVGALESVCRDSVSVLRNKYWVRDEKPEVEVSTYKKPESPKPVEPPREKKNFFAGIFKRGGKQEGKQPKKVDSKEETDTDNKDANVMEEDTNQTENTTVTIEPENVDIKFSDENSEISNPESSVNDIPDIDHNKHNLLQELELDEDTDTHTSEESTEFEPALEPVAPLDEVEDEDEDILEALDEGKYRESTKPAPEVVEVRVEVPVPVRPDPGSVVTGMTPVQAVMEGLAHKTLLFTGDRGSGVTSTAWGVAKFVSSKVPVLYIDADIARHGLLSYLDYSSLIKHDTHQLQGIKLAKTVESFGRCIVRYDNNLDILTSNYGSDVSISDIEEMQTNIIDFVGNYGLIVVDCPLEFLMGFKEFLYMSDIVLCVEGNKRGVLNTLCMLDRLGLSPRHKKLLLNRGTLVYTRAQDMASVKPVIKYVRSLFEFGDYDWLGMKQQIRGKEFTIEFLSGVLNS